jgi:hypothetical protein
MAEAIPVHQREQEVEKYGCKQQNEAEKRHRKNY